MAYFCVLGSAVIPFSDQAYILVIKRDLQLNGFQRSQLLILYHIIYHTVNSYKKPYYKGLLTQDCPPKAGSLATL